MPQIVNIIFENRDICYWTLVNFSIELYPIPGINLGRISVTSGSGATVGSYQSSVAPLTTMTRRSAVASFSPIVTETTSISIGNSQARKKTLNKRKGAATIPGIGNLTSSNILRNIKEEVNADNGTDSATVSSKHNCEICKKQFNATGPLAFHYCKHFYKVSPKVSSIFKLNEA